MITILYVDDEPVMLETLKMFLERDPEFRVITALSSKAALALLADTHCDAIISDYEMPEMDGIEFLKIIREKYPRMPFIIFTGKGREEIVIQSLNYGADYYVRKGGEPRAQFAEISSKLRHAVDLRESQEKVARLNHLYLVLSRINEAIVRIHDRRMLMEEAAKIAVQEGGFIRAWIGFEDTITRQVTAMVAFGTLDGFFTDVQDSSEPVPDRKGLTVTAIRQGKPAISNDILADPDLASWAEEARSLGYRSAASFPLTSCRKMRGAITFFSQEPGCFTDIEIGLLQELSEDISYALDMIEMEASRRKIQMELEMSQRRLVHIINFLPQPTFAIDRSGSLIIWNEAMEQLTGAGADEVIGKGNYEYTFRILGRRKPALLDMLTEPDEALLESGYTSIARNHRSLKAELIGDNIRGEPAILRLTASPLYDEKGQVAGAIESVRDITLIKNAGADTPGNRERYSSFLRNASDAVVVHSIINDRPGPLIWANEHASRMLEYSADELTARSLPDLASPGQEDLIIRSMRILNETRSSTFETDLAAKGGRKVRARVSAQMFDFGGTPVVIVILREITGET